MAAILELKQLAVRMSIAKPVQDYALRLVEYTPAVGDQPRGNQKSGALWFKPKRCTGNYSGL